MIDNWTFGRKIGAGFAFAGAVLVLLSVVGFQSTAKLIEDNRWVQHTHEVRGKLTALIALMTDAETASRGYVITGDDTFLEPYQAAVGAVDRNLGELRSVTSDNPAQQQRLDSLV